MSRDTVFPTILHVRPAKTHICLCIHACCPECLLSPEHALETWLSTECPADAQSDLSLRWAHAQCYVQLYRILVFEKRKQEKKTSTLISISWIKDWTVMKPEYFRKHLDHFKSARAYQYIDLFLDFVNLCIPCFWRQSFFTFILLYCSRCCAVWRP